MDRETRKKIITLSFVVASFLASLVISVLLDTAIGSSAFVARWVRGDLIRHGFPVFCGVVTFFVLQFNKNIFSWADESVLEVSKVVWPTKKDTVAMTVVVCIMLIISSIVLGSLDFISTELVQLLLFSR